MVQNSQIRDRFVVCLNEVAASNTLQEVADKIGTSKSYLSQIKTGKRKIPAVLIANFCLAFNYNPAYILLGTGTKKGEPDQSEIIKLFKMILKEVKNRNKDTEIIHDLLSGMIELDVQFKGSHSKLIQEAKKHIKS